MTSRPVLLFPIDDRVDPKLDELERSGELSARELNDVRVLREVFETLSNVRSMERAADGVARVVEEVRLEDRLSPA